MVVDSSSDGNAERIVSICHSRFGDISNCIRYIHDPCLSSNFYIWMSKMFRALCQVTTPVVVIDSDDDFLDIDVVLHAASLLDKDSSVAAVTGVVKDFSMRPVCSNHDASNIFMSSDGLYCSGRYINQISLTESSTKSRISQMCNIWPVEAVLRTDILRAVFRSCILLGIDNHLGFLHLLRFLISGYGKHIYLSDRVSTFRQDNTVASSGSYINNIYSSKYHYYCDDCAFLPLANASAIKPITSSCLKFGLIPNFVNVDMLSFASISLYRSLLKENIQSSNVDTPFNSARPKTSSRFLEYAASVLFK